MKHLLRIATLSIAISGAGMTVPSLAQPELKGSPEQLREFLHPRKHTVSLSADAEKTSYSDKAYISLQVTTEHEKLSKSVENNQKLRETIISTLVSNGISATDINNAKFSSSPQYGWFGKEPDSYEVTNTVTVSVSNEEAFLTVTKLSDQYKEVKVASTRFEHTQKEAVEAELRKTAMDKVLAQKAFYENRLGVELTAVAFREGEFYARPMVQQAPARLEKAQFSSAPMADSAPQKPTSFDEIEYKTTLFVDFEVQK